VRRYGASWDGQTAWVIGGGPSLRGRDLSGLTSRGRVLGVNRAADFWPVDATFTRDRVFRQKRRYDLAAWAQDHEVYVAIRAGESHDPLPGVRYLTLGEDVGGLNSGHGAIQLALRKGARRIILLGFDLTETGAGPSHWHEGHAWANGKGQRYYERWAADFERIEVRPGVEILNANPESAVRCFPFAPYATLGLERGTP